MTAPQETYFGDVLADFSNGCQLDLRVKMAAEFLQFGAVPMNLQIPIGKTDDPAWRTFSSSDTQVQLTAAGRAEYALDMATALLKIANERGMIMPLPDDDKVNAPTRKHLRRAMRAQIFQQISAGDIQNQEQPSIARPPDGPLPGIPGGRTQ